MTTVPSHRLAIVTRNQSWNVEHELNIQEDSRGYVRGLSHHCGFQKKIEHQNGV